MKNLKKYGILGSIILLLFFAVGFLAKKWLNSLDGKLSLISNNMISVDKMREELSQKDSLLEIIKTQTETSYTFLLREYHLQTLKLNQQNEQFARLNELLKKQGIKIDQLQSNLELTTLKSDTIFTNLFKFKSTDTLHLKDSIFQDYYVFSDSTKNLKLGGELNVKNKTAKITYEHFATYEILTYREKKGLFGDSQLMATIICDDPNTKITLKSQHLKTKKPKYHLGLGLGFSSAYYRKKIIFIPTLQFGVYKPIISIY